MITKGLFSSNSDMWETPQWLFDELNAEFHFTVDVCAVAENAKCKIYFSPETNGLSKDWTRGGGSVYWCNPPYRREIGKWIKKAAECGATVVMLLPARTDTAWFHDYILGKAEIRFLRGRLKFGDSKSNAPFPSMIVIYKEKL